MSTKKHSIPDELVTQLLGNYQKPEDLIGENGLLKQLTKLLVEKALDAEMAQHLGHDKHEPVANATGNTRNGKSKKTLKGDFGELPIEVPRDRHSTFEPQIIPKHQTRWAGFDEKILSLYARGMTVREIQSHLEEIYGAEVSPSLISSVTDAVAEEVKTWQSRPLDPIYPIVYLDCIHVKIREGAVRVKAEEERGDLVGILHASVVVKKVSTNVALCLWHMLVQIRVEVNSLSVLSIALI
jgi:putative transposase